MTEKAPTQPRVIALVATIPARRRSCERLLSELTKQTRKPDGVVLVLDGYGEETPAPICALPVIAAYRTSTASGPGARWRVAQNLLPDDIVVCLDDDIMLLEAPRLIAKLVAAVESGGGAAAAMGRTANGRSAPPGIHSFGDLTYAAGCGLTARASNLAGLQDFSTSIRSAGGPDALGLCGDDDALVSAYLWKTGVRILHAATGNIYAAPNTQKTSQTAERKAKHENSEAQN